MKTISLKIDGFIHDFTEEEVIETIKAVDFLQDAILRLLGDDNSEIYGSKEEYLIWLKDHFTHKTDFNHDYINEVFNDYDKSIS